MDSGLFRTEIVGVSSLSEAKEVAKSLVGDGIQVIELCGGFDGEGAGEIIAYLDSEVPVGLVEFSGQESQKLARFSS